MKKLFALFAVLALICAGTAVSAENTASINSTTFVATINADCPSADYALIMIKNRTSGEYVWASQETVTNGQITNFQAPLDSGITPGCWYDVTVTDNKMGTATASFYFATQTYKDSIVDRLKALKNNLSTAHTDLIDILTNEAPLFTYDMVMFDKITDTTALYSAIIAAEGYETIEQFSEKVDEIVSAKYILQVKDIAIAEFNATSVSGMTTVLENYYDLFGITLDSLYYENSGFINEILSDVTITDADEVEPAFKMAIALAEVNNAERADLMNVFNSYDSYLGLYSKLSSLSEESRNTALKIIEQRTYTNIADIAKDIASAVLSGNIDETPEYKEEENIISVENALLDAERPKIIQDINDKGLVFYDLGDAVWAKNSILRLYELGVVNGRTQTEFAPNSSITRAEYARLVVEAFKPEAEVEAEKFSDVEIGKWYYTSVMSAREAGIVAGDENNCFYPENNLTMQDAAVILCKVLGLDEVEISATFTDDENISGYARGYVYALKAAGIVSGNADGVFAPKSYATRAQCAVMIDKALGEVE